MIKKIPVDQLAQGMYIHDLNRHWTDHPFLLNRFAIEDAATLRKIREAGMSEVYIDVERGRDVDLQPEADAGETAEYIDVQGRRIESPVIDDMQRARRLQTEANTLISNLMHDVRLGRQIEIERCEPVVTGILDFVFHKPDALLLLVRIKRRDQYTFQHSVAVAALAAAFGRTLGMPPLVIKELAVGGLLHDVGKALIPESVLTKPGRLTADELALMKTHASLGADLLEKTPGISEIAYRAAAEHHERFDGSGYPLGLKGEEISLYGLMTAIVDVYDATTSLRAYHAAVPPTDALRDMFQSSDRHFSPSLLQAFIKSIGIYPVGCLVRLESGRLGIVREIVPDRLLQPVIKVFYHADKRCYLSPETIALAECEDRIVANEPFEKWNIDQMAWL